mgnify:CR=1 FL=1
MPAFTASTIYGTIYFFIGLIEVYSRTGNQTQAEIRKMEFVDPAEVVDSLGITYLQELSTFGALSAKVIVDLINHGKVQRLPKGEYIAHFREKADDFQAMLVSVIYSPQDSKGT